MPAHETHVRSVLPAARLQRAVDVGVPDRFDGPLWLRLVRGNHGLQLHLSGELDMASSFSMQILLGVLERAPRAVIVDLGRLAFVSLSGMTPLLESIRRRRADGRPELILVNAPTSLRRVLSMLSGDPGMKELAECFGDGSGAAAMDRGSPPPRLRHRTLIVDQSDDSDQRR